MCSKHKGADQLCSYRTADLHLCFRMCNKAGYSSQINLVLFDFSAENNHEISFLYCEIKA